MSELDPAVADLRRRRKSIMDAINQTELGQALMRIDAALEALTGEAGPMTVRRKRRLPGAGSVRDKAQRLLDEQDRAWTYDAILREYEIRGEPIHATDPKAALRTALWNMTNSGDAIRVEEGLFKSSKWVGHDAWDTEDGDDET